MKLFLDQWKIKCKGLQIASLQTYELLIDLCQSATGTVIDLGSGFSSFVIREYKTPRYMCVSVDTQKRLILTSARFPQALLLHDGEWYLWDEFIERMWMDTTLIFFKIGNTTSRSKYFRPVFDKYLHRGVKILIDDMHKTNIAADLQHILKDYSYNQVDVKDQTLDEYGRFCWLIEGK